MKSKLQLRCRIVYLEGLWSILCSNEFVIEVFCTLLHFAVFIVYNHCCVPVQSFGLYITFDFRPASLLTRDVCCSIFDSQLLFTTSVCDFVH